MQSDKVSPAEKISAMIEEQALTRDELLTMLRQIMEIRALENNIADLLGKAVLKGASHLYAGQEAVAVGAVAALRDDDLITSTHRGHGHAHAHGDKAAKTPEAKQEHYNKMMAEVLGRSGGYCKGKGGSMHIADVLHGNLGATGIVGGNIPGRGRRGIGAETSEDGSRRALLFRRWRVQHRQLSRVAEHGESVGFARCVCRRE